ncbi:nSTAND1 domain-containing NTPase [Streptomyces sp. NPDC002144]
MSPAPAAPRELRAIVIVGVGTPAPQETDRPDGQAIRYAARALEVTLLERCGIPEERLEVLVGPSAAEADSRLTAAALAARTAGEGLLVFYIGHGRAGARGELHMLTDEAAHTAPEEHGWSFRMLSRVLERTGPSGTAVFLDCCFSGRSRKDLRSVRYEPFSSSLPHGCYVLAAVGDAPAVIASDGRGTAFTNALVKLLALGDPRLGGRITVRDSYHRLSSILPDAGCPPPAQFSSGTAGEIVLAENRSRPAIVPRGVEPPDESVDYCPYLGLEPFGPGDAGLFFGRGEVVDLLVATVRGAHERRGMVTVVGASGAGKSSVVHAGLLPALEKTMPGLWLQRSFTPGPHPLRSLATVLADAAGLTPEETEDRLRSRPSAALGLLQGFLGSADTMGDGLTLVVDQSEEMFTLARSKDETDVFLSSLDAIAQSDRVIVVLVLRADFIASATHPRLCEALQKRNVLVPPMGDDAIRRAVQGPAQQVGLDVVPELVERLLSDIRTGNAARSAPGDADPPAVPLPGHDASGVLPLLSHALLETYKGREGRRLTLGAYERTGGVWQAVAKTADEVFHDGLKDISDGEEIAKAILLSMVQLSKNTDDTRRRIRLDDPAHGLMRFPQGSVRQVAERLASARLITLDQESATLTHEALLRRWPKFRSWLDEDRATLYLRQRIVDAAGEWHEDGRNTALVYRGSRLAEALEWAHTPRFATQVPTLVTSFLAAGTAQEQMERRSRRRLKNFRRALFGAVALLAAAAVVAAGYLYIQRQTAISKQAAASALVLKDRDIPTSMQMALAGLRINNNSVTRGSLLSTVASPGSAVLATPSASTRVIATARHQPLAAVGLLSTFSPTQGVERVPAVQLWDTAHPSQPRKLPVYFHGPAYAMRGLAFSDDGTLLAAGQAHGDVWLWHLGSKRSGELTPVRLGGVDSISKGFSDIAFSPDSRWLVALHIDDGVPWVWDLHNTSQAFPLTGADGKPGDFNAFAFLPHGELVAIDDHGVWMWPGGAAHAQRPDKLLSEPTAVLSALSVSSDGRTMAVGTDTGPITLWSLRNPRRPRQQGQTLVGHVNRIATLAFSPDGRSVASAGSDDSVRIWDVADGRQLDHLPEPTSVLQVAFSSHGNLLTLNSNGRMQLWDLPGPVVTKANSEVLSLSFARDGHTLAVGGSAGATLWKVADSHHSSYLGTTATKGAALVGFSPARPLLVAGGEGWSFDLWDVHDPRRPVREAHIKPGMKNQPACVAFSPDGKVLAICSTDGGVYLYDVHDPHRPKKYPPIRPTGRQDSFGEVKTVAFDRTGRTLAVGSVVGVYLLDISDPRHPRRLGEELPKSLPTGTGQTFVFSQIAYSPDGHYVAAGGATSGKNDHAVLLWDVHDPTKPKLTAELSGPTELVNSLAFSRDARQLAAGGFDQSVWLWDVRNHHDPQLVGQLQQHTNTVNSVAFGANSLLASGASDDTARLWETSVSRASDDVCRFTGPDALLETDWKRYVPQIGYKPPCR